MAALAVGGRLEVGVVGAGRVLDGDSDAVIALAALAEVVGLEVERGLGEAVLVRDVVQRVDDVEGVHACRVDVHRRRRLLARDHRVVEDEARAGLASRRARARLVGDNVVALGVGAGVPAVGRGGGVLRVGDELGALSEGLLPDGEDTVLKHNISTGTSND